jgi:hypothetical protein
MGQTVSAEPEYQPHTVGSLFAHITSSRRPGLRSSKILLEVIVRETETDKLQTVVRLQRLLVA